MPAKPPAGLGAAGKALWKRIAGDVSDPWELDERELHTLERACACADDIRRLEAAIAASGPISRGSRGQEVVHPAIPEVRQLRLAEQRLLAGLELADPDAAAVSPAVARARKAATARHARQRKTVG